MNSEIIKQAISKVRQLSEVEDINITDDHVFGIVCHKFFYCEGEFENSTFRTSYCDGANDGGIDLIALNDSSNGSKNLVLIQSKNQSIITKPEILDIFRKMAGTVQKFSNGETAGFNTKLKKIYQERMADLEGDSGRSIELVLFLGLDKSSESKDKIEHDLEKDEALEGFDCQVHYLNEIEQQIELINQGPRSVKEGVLEIFKNQGKITFNEKNHSGILVNAKALSLKYFYDVFRDEGLFEQNYRYYIKNAKIDSQINKSLKDKRSKFWFLNNGIIIACKSFHVDGDNIKLYDFSIVNGCQTTTLIGKYIGRDQSEDFPIACKIIMPSEEHKDDDFFEFSAEIAEASNSQKAIKDRDLKANNIEQKNLKQILEGGSPPIYMEIKRGSNVLLGKKGLEQWQKTNNEKVAQLILTILLQKPGTARANKAKIWSDKKTYADIFRRPGRDRETLVDLLKLDSFYIEWLDNKMKKSDFNEDVIFAASNSKFFILALIGFLIFYYRAQIGKNQSNWITELDQVEISGGIFLENFNLDALDTIFKDLVGFTSDVFNNNNSKFSAFANLTKLDSNYFDTILKSLNYTILTNDYRATPLKKLMEEVFITSNK